VIIPVRVPVGLEVYTVGGVRTVSVDHPLAGETCPVCDAYLAGTQVTLVYVGIRPDDRKATGWTTGAAVAVHVDCTGPVQEVPA
jgi:hypothetical protein